MTFTYDIYTKKFIQVKSVIRLCEFLLQSNMLQNTDLFLLQNTGVHWVFYVLQTERGK